MHAFEAQRVDQIVQESLGGEIEHARVGVALEDLVRDRMHQVSLAEADATVEKQGVVRARGRFRDRARGGVGELVRGTDDEILEGETRVAGARAARTRRARRGRRSGLSGRSARRLESDRELRESRLRCFPSEQLSVPGLDPVGENARRHRNRQHARSGSRVEAELARRPEPRLQLFGVELSLELLEDGGPDLGHRKISISAGFPQLWKVLGTSGGGSICERSPATRDGPLLPLTSHPSEPSIRPLYEAHLSTEQPAPQAHPRLPRPDADAVGPRHHLGAPTQRAQKTHGVNSGPAVSEGFSRDDRLRQRREFEECYASGVRVSGRHVQVFLLPATGTATKARLGISVPKRVGNSVVRNRVRRRLREIFRRSRAGLPPRALSLVVNVRPSAAGAPFTELSEDFMLAVRRGLPRLPPP